MRLRFARLGLLLAMGIAVASLSAFSGRSQTAAPIDQSTATPRHQYSLKIGGTYDYPLGTQSPFLPSNATTDTGEFLDPASFPTAAYCARCHQEAHKEWRESAHANSFRAPWYRKNVSVLMDTKGITYARHCEGCHNPIALLSGSITEGVPQERSADNDGVTCMVCHSIQKVDPRGTGSYVLGQPAVMVDADGKPIYGPVSDREILDHLDRHSKAVMKDFYKTSAYCAACHKAALPETVNDYKWQRAFFLSDEWQMSSFAKQSPLPFYSKPAVSTCQTCHMNAEMLSLPDSGAKAGKLASHRWLGANTMLPTYYKYPDQLAKTVKFLQNGDLNVDLFALDTQRPGSRVAPLGTVPFSLRAGDLVTVSVVIQNPGIAHSLVPEQRDMYESWAQFTVKGANGRILANSGFLNPDGGLDENAHSFTNRLINQHGTVNRDHEVWATRAVAYDDTIQSGRSQLVRYQFHIPREMTRGTLTVTAQVNYRRFNQHFIDFGMGEHTIEPVVVMASRTRLLNVGNNEPVAPDPKDNPDWTRWNNYGIGLLDSQLYAEAIHAFDQVARLRPDYADAYTNIALANFDWQRYDAARTNLEKALAISHGNSRALYYLALVQRNQGKLSVAIQYLKEVLAAFPQSRDAHRELGFSYYQQHQYDLARAQYEALQAIDPDDLAAHYNLSILYRRLGLRAAAAHETAAFLGEKDDPAASTIAMKYLRTHHSVAEETIPWHVHGDIDLASTAAETTR
jgi:tetratricopeptide (TPR) repeat protein